MRIMCKGLEVKFNVSMEVRVGEISEVSESKKVSKDSERMSSDNDHANDVEIKAGFDIGFGAEEYSGEVDLSELTKTISELIKTNVTDKVADQVHDQISHEHKETETNTSSDSDNNRVLWENEDTGEISEEPPKNLHSTDDDQEVIKSDDTPEDKLRGWDEV